ncbi:transposase, partial [Telluribacter sp. SYSU D00476]|uniref:transposase n=1 Tax=Telluribacter sp. SYSU D00476 TaxID=2811430 RepID=UPI001FF1F3F0
IAIQKSIVMKAEKKYVKRSQKDYTTSFKLAVVREIERGEIARGEAQRKYGIQGHATVQTWLRKYGNFDWENQTSSTMTKTPEQKIMELEAKVKLLEKQKAQLEHQATVSEKKAIMFDMMIELAEKEYHIAIRKNS